MDYNSPFNADMVHCLKKVLSQDDCILFVGSGISLWSGLPSWSALIEMLAIFLENNGENASIVRDEAKRGDLLQAASYGFDKLTQTQIGQFIYQACQYGKVKPHAIHEKLVSLGPRCYVTTNYDNLIEESLRQWQPECFIRPPITNRHLTELPNIVQTQSKDFIFKPHGDACDADSIILTREQYRKLLQQGERHATLETLKSLMLSRPIVYLGFGLRDPDFLYLRDTLANTYQGGIRDHYAIMADVSKEEINYWKKNYGIHLVNYMTREKADKTRDHSALLELLDALSEKSSKGLTEHVFDPKCPETILALARYSSNLMQYPKSNPEFPIRVHCHEKKSAGYSVIDGFNGYLVSDFLEHGPNNAILLGLPGAGKSYSIKQSVAKYCAQLNKLCLAESFDERKVIFPIFIDLKLYQGNIVELINEMLPASLPYAELKKFFQIKYFFDAYNEIPKEYWDKCTHETDLIPFIQAEHESSIVISSRTIDGLEKVDMPIYLLDEIETENVTEILHKLNIDISGTFKNELMALFKKPFYFQYITRQILNFDGASHPKDFYRIFFCSVNNDFNKRFNYEININRLLETIAYQALELGEEVFPLKILFDAVNDMLGATKLSQTIAQDIANWLVSISLVIPYSKGRVSFVHQSITEYLAAINLARHYEENPQILKQKLRINRWDQAVFLAMSLLPPVSQDSFFQDIINADFIMSLNAVKYIEDENDRDVILSKLLSEIADGKIPHGERNHRIEWLIERVLPVNEKHESELRRIACLGNTLGAAAVVCLCKIKGSGVKADIMEMLAEKPFDYNFCLTGIAVAIEPFITKDDICVLASYADKLQNGHKDLNKNKYGGFISAASYLLKNFDISVIKDVLVNDLPLREIPPIRAQIICEALRQKRCTESLVFAGELLLAGYPGAPCTIYFISMFDDDNELPQWDSYTESHINCLIESAKGDYWAIRVLRKLCNARQDLCKAVMQQSADYSGLLKALLLSCIQPFNNEIIFNELENLLTMSEGQIRKQINKSYRISDLKLVWKNKEYLLIKLLKLRNSDIALILFGGKCPPDFHELGKIDIDDIEWWLDWMLELSQELSNNNWLIMQLAAFLSTYGSKDTYKKLLNEFNTAKSKYKNILLVRILPELDISINDLNSESISYLFSKLSQGSQAAIKLLSQIATEDFITESVLPLLSTAELPLLNSLVEILKSAGLRHGKRYIFDSFLAND